MPPVRIFYATPSSVTAINAALWLYCNYEIYRVYKGTHPYLSPRLEAAGITQKPTAQPVAQRGAQTADTSERRNEGLIKGRIETGEVRWQNLNGVPIPTLEMVLRPFRRD